jgi:hypothetical protein
MTRRTTLSAEADDIAVLEGEARRRGVSLAQVLRELVEREANELREQKRPSFGIARLGRIGGISISELSWRDEDSPARGD